MYRIDRSRYTHLFTVNFVLFMLTANKFFENHFVWINFSFSLHFVQSFLETKLFINLKKYSLKSYFAFVLCSIFKSMYGFSTRRSWSLSGFFIPISSQIIFVRMLYDSFFSGNDVSLDLPNYLFTHMDKQHFATSDKIGKYLYHKICTCLQVFC